MGSQGLNASYAVPQWMPQFECKGEAAQVLVVLDDVWSLFVLEQLVQKILGCKFLVVSRFNFPTIFNATYQVELLGEEDALSLFCHHAFRQKSIPLGANVNLVQQFRMSISVWDVHVSCLKSLIFCLSNFNLRMFLCNFNLRMFLILDYHGDLHLLCMSNSGIGADITGNVRQLPRIMKVQCVEFLLVQGTAEVRGKGTYYCGWLQAGSKG